MESIFSGIGMIAVAVVGLVFLAGFLKKKDDEPRRGVIELERQEPPRIIVIRRVWFRQW